MRILAKVIIVLAVFLGGFYVGQNVILEPEVLLDQNFSNEENNIQKADLMLDFGDGEIRVFNDIRLANDESVFDLLKRIVEDNEIEFSFQDYGGGLGAMIELIGGRKNDFSADKYWQYWINNEYAKVGASAQTLKDGDIVEWKYIKGQMSY